MTNIVLRETGTSVIKFLALKIRRSSLVFVVLGAVIFALIINTGAALTNEVVVKATQWMLYITIASCVVRHIFQATYKLRSNMAIFTVQYLYLVFLFGASIFFSFCLYGLLPPEFHENRIPVSLFAILGTIVFDSLYNSALDILLPPPPKKPISLRPKK